MSEKPQMRGVGCGDGSAELLAQYCRRQQCWRHRPSALAQVLWPEKTFRSPQGAARAAMNVLRALGGYRVRGGVWHVTSPNT